MKTPKLLSGVCSLFLILSLPQFVLSQPRLDNEALEAVQRSDISSLAAWVAKGGDINGLANNDNTLLMMASKVGDRQTLDYLFDLKADVNAQNKVGTTALMIAAKYGHAHAVKKLLEHGADPTIRNDYGITAARFALAFRHNDVYYQLQQAELITRSNS
jgi:ankyrin repeat protein